MSKSQWRDRHGTRKATHTQNARSENPGRGRSIVWDDVGRRLGLSGRELEIVRLLCEGQKAVAIARELKISRNTVATHLKRLYRKLEVHDRARLVMLVLSAATPGDGHSHSS